MGHRGLGQPHLRLRQRERPAAPAPASPGSLEPGPGAFPDQLLLELGQRREDAEHEAAGRGRGVDLRPLAGEHPQAHLAGRQVLHGVDQMGEVAAKAVELPDDEQVVVPERSQAAYGVDAGRPQGVALQVQRLGAVGLREWHGEPS